MSSGFAAVTLPIAELVKTTQGNMQLLTANDNVDKLRART